MSSESEMWDRFFRGSRYEAKWRKNNALPEPLSRIEEVRLWLDRLESERAKAKPSAETRNPFGGRVS